MPFTRAQLRARVFSDLGQQAGADNELLTAAEVNEALTLGEQQFARDTRCFRRTALLRAVDGQAVYRLPEDLCKVISLTCGEDPAPLTEGDEFWYAKNVPSYRSTGAGAPRTWWMHTAAECRLYPPPAVSAPAALSADAYCVPLAVGGGIAALAWAGGTVTVTTAYRHGLRAGDAVAISGAAPAGYDGVFTVDVTGDTTFTCPLAVDPGAGSGGAVAYAGGCLPMLADSDVSPIDFGYQLAIAHFAAWWLSANHLAGDPVAQASGNNALLKYEALARQYEEARWL